MNGTIDQERYFHILVIFIVLFCFLTVLVAFGLTDGIDKNISRKLSSDPEENIFTLMKYITRMGNGYILLSASIFIIVYFIFKEEVLLSVYFGGMMLSLLPIFRLIKLLLSRPRPNFTSFYASGYSYPSGHTVGAFTFFIGLYVFYQILYKKENNFILFIICLISASAVGASRVILGVHYITDVISGILLSGILIISFSMLYDRANKSIKDDD